MRADFPAGPPMIGPSPGGPDRPFWSVMIPAYNALELLAKALRSVLDQDPGMDRMQIAVVDDCSTNDEARRIVEEMAPGRVEYHRGASNVGLAGNWNAALRLSRGRWVHLLHQDDLVLPGFYERLGRADAEASVGMAFCQNAFIDEDGGWVSISPRGGLSKLRTVCRFNPELRFNRVAFGYRKWALNLWMDEKLGLSAGSRTVPSGSLIPADPGARGVPGRG